MMMFILPTVALANTHSTVEDENIAMLQTKARMDPHGQNSFPLTVGMAGSSSHFICNVFPGQTMVADVFACVHKRGSVHTADEFIQEAFKSGGGTFPPKELSTPMNVACSIAMNDGTIHTWDTGDNGSWMAHFQGDFGDWKKIFTDTIRTPKPPPMLVCSENGGGRGMGTQPSQMTAPPPPQPMDASNCAAMVVDASKCASHCAAMQWECLCTDGGGPNTPYFDCMNKAGADGDAFTKCGKSAFPKTPGSCNALVMGQIQPWR